MKTISQLTIKLTFIFALTLVSFSMQAQEDELQKMKDDFDLYKQRLENKFDNYRDSVDRAFVRFLRDSWKDFAVYAGNPTPIDPDVKPKTQPSSPKPDYNFVPSNRRSEEIASEIVNPSGRSSSSDFKPTLEAEDENKTRKGIMRTIDVPFYGIGLPLQYDLNLKFELERRFNESIPEGWEKLAMSDYYPTLMQFVQVSEKTNLNDWGYVQLVRKFASQLYPQGYNEQVLFTCFMLNKSGYLSKIGYNRQALFLLLPSPQEIYNTPYMTVEGLKYYVYSFNPDYGYVSSIKTYEGQYRDNNHAIDFTFKNPLHLPKNIKTRTIHFTTDVGHAIEVEYNQNLIDFYQDMPAIGFNVTLSAPLSGVAMNSLKAGLAPILEGKSEKEKVDLLLNFVQNGFEYQTDQEQFGKEKYFFPEEVLHFQASDCEDRSALFANLVQELVGLEVLGLVFPQHVATAVKFSTNLEGDFVTHQGQKYLICDPTYIGASSGMAMPKFKNSSVQLVLLD
jgi:hypothetical protein